MAATYFKRREVEGAPAPQQMARDPPPQISSPVTADAWAAKWWEVYQAEPDKAGRSVLQNAARHGSDEALRSISSAEHAVWTVRVQPLGKALNS